MNIKHYMVFFFHGKNVIKCIYSGQIYQEVKVIVYKYFFILFKFFIYYIIIFSFGGDQIKMLTFHGFAHPVHKYDFRMPIFTLTYNVIYIITNVIIFLKQIKKQHQLCSLKISVVLPKLGLRFIFLYYISLSLAFIGSFPHHMANTT